ncbi:hypothetical protein HYV50_02160 [Candidatus Pacearchaeota archaeon]|nr:hypothetical protein [Candidatus Pacearchaeota archaeon]
MNLKRAVWVGIVTYILSLIIGIVVISLLGFDFTQSAEIPNSIFLINIIITIIVVALFTLFYLKDKKINQNAKEGFFFGLVLIILGFIFDVIIFSISAAATNTQKNIIEYYSNPLFWLALILFLATTTIVGAIKGKR